MMSSGQADELYRLGRELWVDSAEVAGEIGELEYFALAHLAQVKSATVGEVKSRISALPSQMSRMIRHLEELGYVSARLNRQDKRKIDLALTTKGRRMYEAHRQAKLAVLLRRLAMLSDQEAGLLLQMLRKMAGAAMAHEAGQEPQGKPK